MPSCTIRSSIQALGVIALGACAESVPQTADWPAAPATSAPAAVSGTPAQAKPAAGSGMPGRSPATPAADSGAGEAAKASPPVSPSGAAGANAALPASPMAARLPEPVGMPIYDPDTHGQGDCAGKTIASVIAVVHAKQPELSDISELLGRDTSENGSVVYGFLRGDGSFALALKRGKGDCFVGCTDIEYWYFETGAACEPLPVGHYHSSPGGACIAVEGEAMWGKPEPPDPVNVCDASKAPWLRAGKYLLSARGSHQPCARSGESIPLRMLYATLTIELMQDSQVPTRGSVIVSGTGHPLIDGRTASAEITRERFSAHVEDDNLPSPCPRQNRLDVNYDFEGFGPRELRLQEVDTPDCKNKPDDYCKGYVELSLSELPTEMP